MQSEQFLRTEALIGPTAQQKLHAATIAVFGLGGVGSFTVEALARTGIGTLILVDNGVIKESNINRQLYATHSKIGKLKVEIAVQHILDINPACIIKTYPLFYTPLTEDKDTIEQLYADLSRCSYIVDAIDTVGSKLLLVEKAQSLNIPIISSMGTGNKIDATKFCIADIYKTSVCPLARVIRKECKKRRIKHFKALFSTELPFTYESKKVPLKSNEPNIRTSPASISFVPSVAGLLLAGEVVRDVLKN